MKVEVVRRTFEAAKHPKKSAERARLNEDAITSEYLPSHRYAIRYPFIMSDGRQNPIQPFMTHTYHTKAEAERDAEYQTKLARAASCARGIHARHIPLSFGKYKCQDCGVIKQY